MLNVDCCSLEMRRYQCVALSDSLGVEVRNYVPLLQEAFLSFDHGSSWMWLVSKMLLILLQIISFCLCKNNCKQLHHSQEFCFAIPRVADGVIP